MGARARARVGCKLRVEVQDQVGGGVRRVREGVRLGQDGAGCDGATEEEGEGALSRRWSCMPMHMHAHACLCACMPMHMYAHAHAHLEQTVPICDHERGPTTDGLQPGVRQRDHPILHLEDLLLPGQGGLRVKGGTGVKGELRVRVTGGVRGQGQGWGLGPRAASGLGPGLQLVRASHLTAPEPRIHLRPSPLRPSPPTS